MSESTAEPKSSRRRLSFQTTQDVVTEVDRLRRTPLKPLAKWNLPQACHHIAATLEGDLQPPESIVPTPDESARRDGFFKLIFADEGLPQGLPTSQDATPPHECGEEAVDRMIAAFAKLSSTPHTHLKVGRLGPVPIDDVVKLHLAHAAHHLSFQQPVTPARAGLKFDTVTAMIDDVETLRRGYTQSGGWSLPQMSFHLSRALKALDIPVTRTERNESEQQRQAFFTFVINGGKIPQGRPMPPGSEPLIQAGDAEIVELLAGLKKLDTATQSYVQFGTFGPVKLDDYKRFVAAHSAHHLAYLAPLNTL